MCRRSVGAAVVAAALVLGLAGCGSDKPASTSDGSTTTTTAPSGSDASSSPTSSIAPASDGGVTSVPGGAAVGDCTALATSYAGLTMSALGGKSAAEQAATAVKELRSKLPSDLEGAIKTVAAAYATIAEQGIVKGGAALDSTAYKNANKKIEDYLDRTCNTAS